MKATPKLMSNKEIHENECNNDYKSAKQDANEEENRQHQLEQ